MAVASGLSTLAEADASMGAATLRLAAAARSTGAARSRPRSTLALTSRRDRTSLLGRGTAASASISLIETNSSGVVGTIPSTADSPVRAFECFRLLLYALFPHGGTPTPSGTCG